MNQAGFVATAMAGLWIAYLVPHRLRYRQQLLESRTEDRFSEQLRVLRVAEVPVLAGGAHGTTTRTTGVRQTAGRPGRVHLHSPRQDGAGGGGGPMDRPHGTRDRLTADAARRSAAEHSQRAAHLARRAAGARRRALLTAVLLLAVVAGWSVVGVTGATVLLGAVPTAGLVGVLALGRRAVVAAARADAAWAGGAATRIPLPAARGRGVVGRAVRPTDWSTEVMTRVPASASARPAPAATTPAPSVSGGAAAHATGEAGAREQAEARPTATSQEPAPTWAPVPVPRPTYTLKPEARRAEPAPLVLDDVAATEAAAATPAAERDAAPAAQTPAAQTPAAQTPAPAPAGLDLDAILARRRASGE